MASPRFPDSLSLLTFSLLLQLAASYPMGYSCSGTNISSNSPFNQTLNNLLRYLDSKTPLTGFGSGSRGRGRDQSRVYGLAICQGGLNTSNCTACVDLAIKEIQTVCQSTEAIIFYDDCHLKYSDRYFFGVVDQDHWFYVLEPTNASNPVYFNKRVIELLNKLKEEAYTSPKMYAARASAIGNSTKIYGLVQCTLDLSNTSCKNCLTEAINFIPQYLYGKTGGEQLGGSCTVRFEVYPFVNGA